MQELKDIWNLVLNLIEKEVTAVSFDLWIKTLEPLEIKRDKLVLLSPSTTAKTQLLKNHSLVLKTCIAEVMTNVEGFEIVDPSEKDAYNKTNELVSEKTIDVSSQSSSTFNSKYTFDFKNMLIIISAISRIDKDEEVVFNYFYHFGCLAPTAL